MSLNPDHPSAQPTDAAAAIATEKITDNGREDSQLYQGVEKIKKRPIYVGHVWEDDHATPNKKKTYLGKYDKEEDAARAHDLVTLKFHGSGAQTNFPESGYKKAMEAMNDMTKEEVVSTVRTLSNSYFFKPISAYHGVTRHVTGKWEANYGIGIKSRTLGLFDSEKEAARAYDVESIRMRGEKAYTNFYIKNYNVGAILNGETDIYNNIQVELPIDPLLQVLRGIIAAPKIPPESSTSRIIKEAITNEEGPANNIGGLGGTQVGASASAVLGLPMLVGGEGTLITNEVAGPPSQSQAENGTVLASSRVILEDDDHNNCDEVDTRLSLAINTPTDPNFQLGLPMLAPQEDEGIDIGTRNEGLLLENGVLASVISQDDDHDCDTSLSLAIKRPDNLEESRIEEGSSSSSSQRFQHASSSAFSQFNKK